jgi:hypothetical protein
MNIPSRDLGNVLLRVRKVLDRLVAMDIPRGEQRVLAQSCHLVANSPYHVPLSNSGDPQVTFQLIKLPIMSPGLGGLVEYIRGLQFAVSPGLWVRSSVHLSKM